MEETSSNLHMKPINHLSEEKKCQTCHIHSFLLFERGLVERFIQTVERVAHDMTPAKDNLQHVIANLLMVCMTAVHAAINHILGML